MDTHNRLVSSRYTKITLFLSLAIGTLCFLTEYEMYRTHVHNKLIGLNQAWQSNANLETNIRENYPDYVQVAYKDIENFTGIKNEENIKKWFDVFLERVYNVDTLANYENKLVTNDWHYNGIWKTSREIDIINKINYNKGKLLEGRKPKTDLPNKSLQKKAYKKNLLNKAVKSNAVKPDTVGKPFVKVISTPDAFSLRIFNEYVDYIQYSLPKLLRNKDILNNDFNEYNKAALNTFFQKDLDDFILIAPYIKIHRFFISSMRTVENNRIKDTLYSMAIYPNYADQEFNNLDIPERPWFKAAVSRKFPLHYKTADKNYQAVFGVTGLYNDIGTVTTTLLDRTFTCSFTIPNINPDVRFVACLDLFFDNSVEFICPNPFTISRKANVGYTSLFSYISFMDIDQLALGYCSILDSILLFLVVCALAQVRVIKKYVIRGLEGIINQINSENFIQFHLHRVMVYSLTSDNVMSPPKIKIEDTTKWVKKEETTIEQSVGIDGKWKWFSFNFLRKQANVNGNEQSVTEGTTVELTLGIDNINYYRRLEFWKIYIGHKRVESGEFIVKWMNAIYTKEEIAIDLKRGEFRIKLSEKKENEVLVHLKKKFENRLLTSEESDFIIKVDLTPQNQGPLEIPYSIQNCVVENENIVHYFTRIGRLNRFYEKKLFFRYRDDDTKELNYFIQLYANMDIYSICGLEFLENLKNNKGLPIFIKSTEDTERLYIEETPNELGTFLNSLTPELRLEMKDLKPEKFIIFPFIDKNIELIKKYKNYDFALVKNNLGQTEYILYHTPTSTSAEIGWASWRIIDIDFYNAVYRVIKTELYPNSISIKEYIKTRTKNNAVK